LFVADNFGEDPGHLKELRMVRNSNQCYVERGIQNENPDNDSKAE